MTDQERIVQIKKRMRATSPGKWVIAEGGSNLVSIPAEDALDVRQFQAYGEPSWDYTADMEFIAHARDDIQFLLSKLEAK